MVKIAHFMYSEMKNNIPFQLIGDQVNWFVDTFNNRLMSLRFISMLMIFVLFPYLSEKYFLYVKVGGCVSAILETPFIEFILQVSTRSFVSFTMWSLFSASMWR